MVNFPGRTGRRRRVLKDEVLAASNSRVALRAVADDDWAHPAPRYSNAAGVENHPQITDFVPRRYRTIVLLVLTGTTTTVTLAALDYTAPSLAAAVGLAGLPPFNVASPGSLAAWIAAVVLLVSSMLSLLIYSIRRHRIDDFRGRYRIWLAASAACLMLSANSVAGLHHLLAYSLSHITGWSALRSGAVWWLAIAGVPLAWIALRSLLDVKECRLAAALLITATACYLVAVASYLGLMPVIEPRIDAMLYATLSLAGHWLLLAAVVSYARFVVLDAQSLIPIRRSVAKPRSEKAGHANRQKADTAATTPSLLAAAGYTRQKPSQLQPVESTSAARDWVDGSRPEREQYDDDDGDGDSPTGSRKLSKAERKKLRKLKAQQRAA